MKFVYSLDIIHGIDIGASKNEQSKRIRYSIFCS